MGSQGKKIGEVAAYFAELAEIWQKEVNRLSELSFQAWENCHKLEGYVINAQKQHAKSQLKIAMSFCENAKANHENSSVPKD